MKLSADISEPIDSRDSGVQNVFLDDSVLPHPQMLNLAERMERAVYLGLDGKAILAKFVTGRKIL